jgi:hypothetical protein
MSRVNIEDPLVSDIRIKRGWRLEKMVWIPTNGAALDINAPPYIDLNPAGAVTILMPTSNAARAGICFLFTNPSGSTVTFNTDTNVAFATAIALATTQNAILICTGSTTPNLGWRKIPSTAA